MAYDGPLSVLVDRFSASASEIFAAAIQDYGRGLVLGQQTYGKGSVQNLYPLDRYALGQDPGFGQLTVTIGKYYRVTGESTQHRGVQPDIRLPSAISIEEVGESTRDGALPWDRIRPAEFRTQGSFTPLAGVSCSAPTTSAWSTMPTSGTRWRNTRPSTNMRQRKGRFAQPQGRGRPSVRASDRSSSRARTPGAARRGAAAAEVGGGTPRRRSARRDARRGGADRCRPEPSGAAVREPRVRQRLLSSPGRRPGTGRRVRLVFYLTTTL